MLEGHVALITGASRGIGLAVARAFLRAKSHVVINDIAPEEDLTRIAKGMSTSAASCTAIRADVSEMAQVRQMIEQVVKRYQRLDILVNNAGIIRRGSIETVTEEDWDQVLRVNLKGTFNCCKVAADIMVKQRGGKIINISSIAGKTGDITSAPGYGPSKAAVDALTKTLAR